MPVPTLRRMASASDESPIQTDAEHQEWADEHLRYEVNTLTLATLAIPDLKDRSKELAFALESWAIHTRCLFEFLWFDRNKNHPGDAFATDFCRPGEWKAKRGQVPPTLQQISDRRRIGREIVHLSYHRASVKAEDKAWGVGRATTEILDCLKDFADTARPERLMDKTRDHLRAMHAEYGSPTAGPSVATGMVRTEAGTLLYSDDKLP